MKTVVRVILGLVVGILSLAVSASPARAVTLSFCFNSEADCNQCFQQVFYSVDNGKSFQPLFAIFGDCNTFCHTPCLKGTNGATQVHSCGCPIPFKLPGCVTHIEFKAVGSIFCCGRFQCVCLKTAGGTVSPNCDNKVTFTPGGCIISFCVCSALHGVPATGTISWEGGVGNQDAGGFTFVTNSLPEPPTYLALVGGLGLLYSTRRRKSAA
jgi:hypothetical protein